MKKTKRVRPTNRFVYYPTTKSRWAYLYDRDYNCIIGACGNYDELHKTVCKELNTLHKDTIRLSNKIRVLEKQLKKR